MTRWSGLAAVRHRPELTAIVAIAVAWPAVIVVHLGASLAGRHDLGGEFPSVGRLALVPALSAGVAEAAAWTAMSVAMMVPLIVPSARHVALNSLRRRRHRAVATFLAAFVAVWAVFGLTVSVVAPWTSTVLDAPPELLLPAALTIAALWQVTPWKRMALHSRHRLVPLPPRGWRAMAACLHFGSLSAARCVGSCWALMAVMAVVIDAHLAWMAGLSAIALSERYLAAVRRAPWLAALGLAGLAVAALVSVGPDGARAGAFLCPIPAS